MTYTWITFNIDAALNGVLVGIGGSTTPDDISKVAGNLVRTELYSGYKVVINGKTAYLDSSGKVVKSVPSTAFTVNQQFYLATATINETVGGVVTRSASSEAGYSQQVDLTTIEPRDTFAIQILSAMLVHSGNPESFDDASITMYSRAAYRWAQSMMEVAANARHGQSQSSSPSAPVDVKAGDLKGNVEKLLYNMAEYMKSGVTVKGSTTATPVQIKITQMPDIVIDSLPNLTVDSLPKIVLGNQPTGTITIDPTTLQTNEEKLLYNIVLYMNATMEQPSQP